MNSYEEIAKAAGTTVNFVKEVAKTIYKGSDGWYESGYEDTNPLAHVRYATKTEAILLVARRREDEAAAATLADMLDADKSAREEAISEAGKAMDAHTPVRIYTDNCAIYDYVAGIEGNPIDVTGLPEEVAKDLENDAGMKDDSTIVTEHFGSVFIADGEATEVAPWDMTATDKPMLCAYGATLKWTSGTLAHSWYESSGTNDKGEHLVVEMDTIDGGDGSEGWLLSKWAKRGLIKPMASAWNTNVYVRMPDGKTMQAYNPQIAANGEIAFDWILERTEENRAALLRAILRRFTEGE